jgi:hypothetical protein
MPEELDSENYWPDNNSCSQTQNELEEYRLQELAESPYRIELKPDLTKEQGLNICYFFVHEIFRKRNNDTYTIYK